MKEQINLAIEEDRLETKRGNAPSRGTRERPYRPHLSIGSVKMIPEANKPLLVVAAGLLAIPVVALLWVDSYAKVEPTFAGFRFFIWCQIVS
jgi:hypothetical protein